MDNLQLEPPTPPEEGLNETFEPEPGVNTGVNYDRPPEIVHGPTHITKTRV